MRRGANRASPAKDLAVAGGEEFAARKPRAMGRLYRSKPLQDFLNDAGDLLLSPEAPQMASYIAGKAFHRLERVGHLQAGGDVRLRPQGMPAALSNLLAAGGRYARIAASLAGFVEDLPWRRVRSGPFASVNFSRSGALATIAGPDGLEARNDMRIGLVFMEPYSRFPDHDEARARTFLFLSKGEVSLGEGAWAPATIGTVFANEAGERFAMRCTAQPLLSLWCEFEPGHRLRPQRKVHANLF